MAARRNIALALAAIFLVGAIFWLRSAVGTAREAARRVSCVGNLSQLALACLNYESKYGTFPTAITPDGYHSWRTLILAQVHETDFADKIDTSRAWDSPAMASIRKTIPQVFQCHGSKSSDTTTRFFCVRAPNGIWQEQPITLRDIADGPECTLLLIELALPGVHWMQPKDITLSDLVQMLEKESGLPTPHDGVVQVAFANGRCMPIAMDKLTPELLRAMVTINGGEDISTWP